jgi:hypothetical protein
MTKRLTTYRIHIPKTIEAIDERLAGEAFGRDRAISARGTVLSFFSNLDLNTA